MDNNPLHSLIYSTIGHWTKIHCQASSSEILTDINIIRAGDSNKVTKKLMIESLAKRITILQEMINSTNKMLAYVIEDEPIAQKDQAYAQGYLSKLDDINPYRHISKKLAQEWQRGRDGAININEVIQTTAALKSVEPKYNKKKADIFWTGFYAKYGAINPYNKNTKDWALWQEGHNEGHIDEDEA